MAPRVLVGVFGLFGTKIGDILGGFYGMNESDKPAGGLLDLKIVRGTLFLQKWHFLTPPRTPLDVPWPPMEWDVPGGPPPWYGHDIQTPPPIRSCLEWPTEHNV